MKFSVLSIAGVLAFYCASSQNLPSDSIRIKKIADSIRVGYSGLFLAPVEITAVRAGDKTPFTKLTIGSDQIAKMNNGQDLPYILDQTPSVVASSDAGNGIGYTGITIRGSRPWWLCQTAKRCQCRSRSKTALR